MAGVSAASFACGTGTVWTRAAGVALNAAAGPGAPRAAGRDGSVVSETTEQEVRRLRREVAVLRQEQAFAKKVAVYFAKESR